MTKSRRAVLAISLASVFAGPPLSAIAQQPANQQPASGAASGAGAVNGAEAEHKSSITTFQSDTPVARYDYYWWRGNCYYRDQSGHYVQVLSSYCS
jgi:hypothetical protein